jgi:quinohemoprotein ethanol dehydrogenase
MSLDVEAGLAYLPVVDNGFVFALDEEFVETGQVTPRVGSWNLGVELGKVGGILANYPDLLPPDRGYLRAFDPLSGETRWSVELPHHWNGGVVATAGGLLFQGDATGHVSAYDKASGERLWRFNAWSSIVAPPITFMHEGIQYVSIMTGSGGGALFFGDGNDPDTWVSSKYGNTDRLLVFKLGGAEELPRPTLVDRTIPPQDLGGASDEAIARGEDVYMNDCAVCHGMHVRSSLAVPDLRRMQAGAHELFRDIVLGGIYVSNGMASFADALNEQDVEDVHLYIRARAEEDRLVAAGAKEAARLTWFE